MLENGKVGVFSRNSEDMSKKYPDLVEQLPRVSTSTLFFHLKCAAEEFLNSASKITRNRSCLTPKRLLLM